MKRVFFLLNSMEEFDFDSLIKKYLSAHEVEIGDTLPKNPGEFDIISPWCYRKIIPNTSRHGNFVVFHSTDLPEGKGWAPIYNTLINQKEYYTLTAILAADKVDSGEILAKARFKLLPPHTAPLLRVWDDEISIILINRLLERESPLRGRKQTGKATYNKRRKPEDNEISSEETIKKHLDHLRACEADHPAYFHQDGHRFNITISPDITPEFPKDLEIEFFSPAG